jgi:hypothetical protein
MAHKNPTTSEAPARASRSTRTAATASTSALKPLILTAAAQSEAPNQVFADLLGAISTLTAQDESSIREVVEKTLGDKAKASTVRVFLTGQHQITDGLNIAAGDATVAADGRGIIIAVGTANARCSGQFDVYAGDRASVTLFGDVQAYVVGQAVVQGSYDRVRGFAGGTVRGTSRGTAHWTLAGKANFNCFENSNATCRDEATANMFGRSRVVSTGKSRTLLHDNAYGLVESAEASVELNGRSIAYVANRTNVVMKSDEAVLLDLQPGQFMAPLRAFQLRGR